MLALLDRYRQGKPVNYSLLWLIFGFQAWHVSWNASAETPAGTRLAEFAAAVIDLQGLAEDRAVIAFVLPDMSYGGAERIALRLIGASSGRAIMSTWSSCRRRASCSNSSLPKSGSLTSGWPGSAARSVRWSNI